MVAFMFWNTNGSDAGEAIGDLCRDHEVDILLLAETGTPSGRLVTRINGSASTARTFWELPHLESRVRAFTHFPPGMVRPAFDDGQVKMLALHLPIGPPLLVVAAHLLSKLWAGEAEQKYRIRRLREDIEAVEARLGHRNSLVIGDLNVNPFEDALTAADGLQGVMDKEVARRSARSVQGQAWNYFYNPMWSRLGDDSVGRSGTYWHAGSGLVNHFWNTFDQVLLRPGLLPFYDPAGLVVPTHIAGRSILPHPGGEARLSDHLPVVLTLSIEEETDRG